MANVNTRILRGVNGIEGTASSPDYIKNSSGSIGTNGWVTYNDSLACTFDGTADTVSALGAGLSNGMAISFSNISGTSGIANNTYYYVANYVSDTNFQLFSTPEGSGGIVGLTGNGSAILRSSRPVNGVGGVSEITLSSTTTTPLRENSSLVFSIPTLGSKMGTGASYDFTIDEADKAKVLEIDITYAITSGSFTAGNPSIRTANGDSDITAWIFDVTNGVLIQPSSYRFYSNSALSDRFSGYFQTSSNSTSYRLILHKGTPTIPGSQIDFKFNVSITPSEYVYGTPITDWVSTTITGSWTNNTTYVARERRVGDCYEYDATANLTGAPNAIGLLFNLPNGRVIDTSKLSASQQGVATVGQAIAVDQGNSTYPGKVSYYNTTSVIADIFNTGSTYGLVNSITNTVPFTFGNTDYVQVRFSVPIVGLSSSVQMSDSTDTRIIAASYKFSTSRTVSNTQVADFDTKIIDTHNAVTIGSNWRFITPVPGPYRVSVYMISASAMANSVIVDKNSGSSTERLFSGTAALTSGSGSILVDLRAGDTIAIRRDAGSYSADYGIVSIERITGPSAIAATETIAVRYSSNSGQSISTTPSIIVNFEDMEYDTHGAVTIGASWRFTAPASGIYEVKSAITYNATNTWGVGEDAGINLWKNGVGFCLIDFLEYQATVASSVYTTLNGSTELRLNAGEYIDLRTSQGSGAALTLTPTSGENWITVRRVGL